MRPDNDRARRGAATLVCLGLLLFLLGLLLGFVLIPMAGAKAMLSAHEAALGSGTFLIAFGLAWRTFLRAPPRWLATALWIPHYLLAAGLALGAPALGVKAVGDPLVLVASLAMTAATVIALILLIRDARALDASGAV